MNLQEELDFYLRQLDGAIALTETRSDDIARDVLDIARQELCDFCLTHRAALVVLAPDERVVVPLAYGWHETAYNPKDVGQWVKVARIDNPHWIVHTNDAAPRPDGDV